MCQDLENVTSKEVSRRCRECIKSDTIGPHPQNPITSGLRRHRIQQPLVISLSEMDLNNRVYFSLDS